MTTVILSEDKWRDAVKFLMGLGCNPTLTASDQRTLRQFLRGPFANGMSNIEARRVLGGMGWQKRYPQLITNTLRQGGPHRPARG